MNRDGDSPENSPGKNGEGNPESNVCHEAWPPASVYTYELEELECDDSDEDNSDDESERKGDPRHLTVPASDVRRPRGAFTRAKNKLYVKFATEVNSDGVFVVREPAVVKYDLDNMEIDQVFVGPKPVFQVGAKAKIKKARPVSLDPVEKKKKVSSGAPKQSDIRKFVEKGDERLRSLVAH
jgi:hypothetical protein